MKIRNTYERTCNRLSEFVSQERRNKTIYPFLEYVGITTDFDVYLGERMLLVLILALIGFLLPWTGGKYFGLIDFSNIYYVFAISILLALIFAATTALIYYLRLYYIIEDRAMMAESILPDFLTLVSSNIKAGMTPFSAFRNGARSEFGPLAEEIKIATTKSLGTESFSEALQQLSRRIRSRILKETVSFFAQSIRSGGHIAKLLEITSNDIRSTLELKKELVSSTRMYVIFVIFVVIVATPLLLAISVHFLDMITQIQAGNQPSLEEVGQFAFLATGLDITAEFMLNIAYALLVGNALLAGLFIGVLGSGKAKLGLRYSPLILIVSFVVFLFAKMALSNILIIPS